MFEFLEAERRVRGGDGGKSGVEALYRAADEEGAADVEGGETEHLYVDAATLGQLESRAADLFKAEVVRLGAREPKDNARFVVTNLRRVPQRVYEVVYCQRANIENRIKELLYGLAIDRTSCTSFWANQMRVMLTAAAYVLMQELRLCATGTTFARAQVTTLRERLLKLCAWFECSVRRVVLHLPDSAPWRSEWCRVARSLGVAPS